MALQLSAYDLHHLTQELQILVGGKIEKVFQQEKPHQDFLFSIHVSGKPKQYLYLSLPGVICLSDFKPSFPSLPPAFCSSLRRKITNTRIVSVNQHEFQRIITIHLEGKNGSSTLVIELFSQGNVILLDENNTILAVLHRKIWNEERKILHGNKYIFPEQQFNIKTLSQDDFSSMLSTSTKDSVVTSLAIEVGLGGVYAEKVLEISNINKDILPKEVKDTSSLFSTLQELVSQKTIPVRSGQKIYPAYFDGESYPTLSKAIASIVFEQLQAKEEQSQTKEQKTTLSKFEKVMKSQKSQQRGLEKSAKENQEAGELIYKHYAQLKEILEVLSSQQSWDEKKEKLSGHSLIKKIDQHTGQVQVELE